MTKQRDKIYMPMGTGGLLRYSEEEKVLIKVKPKIVVAVVAGLVVFEIILKLFFT